jgi:hypothetical protein
MEDFQDRCRNPKCGAKGKLYINYYYKLNVE